MSLNKLMDDGKRQMQVCNACRYCEGYCAVWRAIEWRRNFTDKDMSYLANLCHDCKECVFACPFTTPHQFGINPPKLFGSLREELYKKYAWPSGLGKALGDKKSNFWIIAVIGFILLVAIVLGMNGAAGLFRRHVGTGAFYKVLSEVFLEIAFGALGLWFVGGWIIGAVRFWNDIKSPMSERVLARDIRKATADALKLRYLGREATEEELAGHRKWLHQFVLYGFVLDFASTTLGAFYSHVLHIQAPYPIYNPVVILGILGGIGIIIGTSGFLYVKSKSDRSVSDEKARRSGNAFSISLLMIAVTGMLVLLFRDTAAMGIILVIHLSSVASLFFTAPYSKFVHFVYRYMALIRYAQEERTANEAVPSTKTNKRVSPTHQAIVNKG
ncbi:MAG: tricarballylate utilization 4Fe-4S protein TcuB [Alicyclobacillus herbarius]|uniref:tricarballylate utilization 4Fe-4S protein TcuB n=1 Tax=Alicyclobacillus herbarius TaxID=122960 RepID=UPI00041FAE9E|nr:tricarballylate utilization 4Fe-4S protein TcuB [Alicyclobacillus herbarius]MCL6631834.1 tricarballylate utilization 4Fe-4S protein TcuB [Alicyclobacillus herbarius]